MADDWYVYKEQQRRGPFTREQLQEQALAGDIQPEDRVWSEATSGWVPGKGVEGLFPQKDSPPPPAPPPPDPPDVPVPAEVPKARVEPASPAPPPAVPTPEGKALTVGQYFLFLLLCAIPVVNLVLLLVWSFGSRTCPARKNLARAILVLGLIAGVVSLAVYMVWLFFAGR